VGGRLCCKGQERYQSGGNSFGARKNPQSRLEKGIQVRGASISCFNDFICNCIILMHESLLLNQNFVSFNFLMFVVYDFIEYACA